MSESSHQLATSRRFSVAPMLDWTDKHCRYFYRLLSKNTLLYTEMVTTGAIIFGKGDYLGFNAEEHPVALQLGGSDPEHMTICAQKAEEHGYDEVNINVGCPSDRVKNGQFGACLMAEPQVVANCVEQMQTAVSIPVTVKCRIGIDDMDEYKDLSEFVRIISNAGCQHFIIHARKAWLQGLSPKENREIPPLKYDRVYQLKQEFSHLNISINGGIKTIEEAKQHLKYMDGVMLGREIYANPYLLTDVEREIFGSNGPAATRDEVVAQMVPYIQMHIENGGRAWHVARHMLGLYQGQPAARVWRRFLSQNLTGPDVKAEIVLDALEAVQSTRAQMEAYRASQDTAAG